MTEDTMALGGLMEKSADADLLREMIGFAAERLMELEVGGLTGAAIPSSRPDVTASDSTPTTSARTARREAAPASPNL